MSIENPLPNPFDAIEKRSAAEWERFLIDNPEFLDDDCGNAGFPARKTGGGAADPKFAENGGAAGPISQTPSISQARLTVGSAPQSLAPRHACPGAVGDPLFRCWEDIPNILTLEVPPIEWMVEGILPRASVMMLAGEAGSYKTWLALALLRGVATGGNFLGRRCAQANVLYLDRENPLVVMRERLRVLGIEGSAAADCHHPSTQNQRAGDPGFRIWGGWFTSAPPAISDFRLLEIAHARRPLIVFDSLIRFHAAADENSATEMAVVMADLRALANAGATVVALHHKPKSEAYYRGSTDIEGAVDTALAVSRDRDAGLLRFECRKGRFAEEFTMTLRPELAAERDFVVTDAPEVSTEQSDIEKLAEAIRLSPGQPKRHVIEVSGVGRDRARALLERLDGQLWQSRSGLNNATLFFPAGPEAGTSPNDPE